MSDEIKPKSGRGGKRENAGKPLGSIGPRNPDTNADKVVLRAVREELNISEQFANAGPLEIMLLAMRHYASSGSWAIAASIAEKAAKYTNAPISPKVRNSVDTDSDVSDGALKLIMGKVANG